MRLMRVVSGLTMVGLFLGTSVTGASALSDPTVERQTVAAPALAQDDWYRSPYYTSAVRCNEVRRDVVGGGNPTLPTNGCYRNANGYYFSWFGSYWDGPHG